MIRTITLLFIFMLFISTESFPLIINVPGNYPTIATAIQASTDGDTVLVEPGTYFENLNFRGKKIVLTSRYYLSNDTSFICSTIINGSQPTSDTASCIILNSGEDSTAVIQGFTITGGAGTPWSDVHGAGTYREGGGIITEFSSPVIRDNYIVNNVVTNTTGVSSTGGGGIRSGDGHPKIYNNVIAHNQGRYGAGIVFNYCNNAEVKNNLIVYNEGGQSFGGGGIWATGTGTSQVIIVENNTIANNHVSGAGNYGGRGGGIFVFSVKVNSKNNIIWGNTQSTGNAIAIFTGGVVNAEYSNIDYAYSGNGNINADPLFVDSVLFLTDPASPCVDAGDSSALYNDPSVTPGTATFPAQGTERNDIGSYGGPGSRTLSSCNIDFTGIIDINSPDFQFMVTNPVHDSFSVQSEENKQIEIKMYSPEGKILLNKNATSNEIINLPDLNDGLYLLEIFSKNSSRIIKKIIVIN